MTTRDAITRAASRSAARATAAVRRIRPRGAAPAPPAPPGAQDPPVGPSELRRRRDELARRLADLQWDLGGLTYEMAIRDHFRLDVLLRAAAELQGVDAELGEIERLLRLDDAGAAGSCPSCSAMHARGAPFCWRCGTALLEPAPAVDPSAVAARP